MNDPGNTVTDADGIAADYAKAGFGGALGWGSRPALLMIDMIEAYFRPGSPFCLPDPEVVDRCAMLLEATRRAGTLVVHTRVEYTPGLADGGVFVRKVPALGVLEAGHPDGLGEFVAPLRPQAGEVVVVKQYASAFFGTSVAATLVANGVDSVFVAGVSTSGCVRASATDAMQHGFIPKVVADACGDRNPAVHDANLFDLDAKYADVVDLDTACARMAFAD
ncbi:MULTISPECIES: isochorismatase family protein [Gordonia]|uniref:isochorismatase family protein n=1 Tax=Gordonia TaxID=2053 RepID=UPI00244CDF43|nr:MULTISPECIES: isochorismatase family protein [Gordonia]MDH3022613.1 isochorismatase family protein [Gordonia alkanivorans]MDJ0009242.1 isochorismatase family protein [Gordonia alkanivorans]MDJ0099140.1 isochorismatase family protein [Gordonia alkanivorans]MDJ0494817.1 isochorismatase family protein [Gordonia alkanivorans]WJG13634.1 isochorismatase family protein [Gordonia sp. Swx-4]